MRIEGIKRRLENWARWCAKDNDGGLGYSSVNMLARMSASVGSRECVIVIYGHEEEHTQTAVDSLRFTHPDLHVLLTFHYAKGYELKRVAKHMCKAESTIKASLGRADAVLEAWLVAEAKAKHK